MGRRTYGALFIALCALGGAARPTVAQLGCPLLSPVPGSQQTAGAYGEVPFRGYDPKLQQSRAAPLLMTCSGNNTFLDLLTNTSYKRPDQILVWNTPAGKTATGISTFKKWEEYFKWIAETHYTGISLGPVGYLEGDASVQMRQMLQLEERVVMHSASEQVAHKVEMRWDPAMLRSQMGPFGPQSLSPVAIAQALLPSARSTPAQRWEYRRFIDAFGTHYVDSAFTGGTLQINLAMNASFYASMNATASVQIAGLVVLWLSGIAGIVDGDAPVKADIDLRFREAVSVTMTAYGGNTLYLQVPGAEGLWSASIAGNPAPINATFVSMSELVVDPVKRALLAEAIAEYLAEPPDGRSLTSSGCGSPPGISYPSLEAVPNTTSSNAARDSAAFRAKRDQLVAGQAEQRRAIERAASATVSHAADGRGIGGPVGLPIVGTAAEFGLGNGMDLRTGRAAGRVWRDPSTYSYSDLKLWSDAYVPKVPLLMAIPNSFDFVDTPSACFADRQAVVANLSAAVQAEASAFGVGGIYIMWDLLTAAFAGFATETAELSAYLKEFASALLRVDHSYTMYRLALASDGGQAGSGLGANLNPAFAADVAALPNATGGDTGPYRALIAKYGTHVLASQAYGGGCAVNVTWDQSALASFGTAWIGAQAGLGAFGALTGLKLDDAWLSAMFGAVEASATFKTHSNVTLNCYGGNLTLLEHGQFAMWAASLILDPAAVPGTQQLRLLSDYVAEPSRHALLEAAIYAYLKGGSAGGEDGADADADGAAADHAADGAGGGGGIAGRAHAAVDEPTPPAATASKSATAPESGTEMASPKLKQAPPQPAPALRGADAAAAVKRLRAASSATAAAAAAAAAGTGPPRVTNSTVTRPRGHPAVCDPFGTGTIGVGCTFFRNRVDAFDLGLNPLRLAVEWQWCPDKCYTAAHHLDRDCGACLYTEETDPSLQYAVPRNLVARPVHVMEGCYEKQIMSVVSDYWHVTETHTSSSGWFSSTSTTTIDFLRQYFAHNRSLAIGVKTLINTFGMMFPPGSGSLTRPHPDLLAEVQATLAPLGGAYDADVYAGFVQAWGTDVVTAAYMGGTAQMSLYYDSCLVDVEGYHYVDTESSSSFLGIFNDDSSVKINETIPPFPGNAFMGNSSASLTAIGGNGADIGAVSLKKPLTHDRLGSWYDSIILNQVPVRFALLPLPQLLEGYVDAAIVANLNRSIHAFAGNVSAEVQDLINEIKPPTPPPVPGWCKAPTPPLAAAPLEAALAYSRRANAVRAADRAAANANTGAGAGADAGARAGEPQALGFGAECPKMPSSVAEVDGLLEEYHAYYRAHRAARALSRKGKGIGKGRAQTAAP